MTKHNYSQIIGYACMTILCCIACTKTRDTEKPRSPIPVKVQVIDSIQSSVERTYVGEVQSVSSTPLSFALGGTISRIAVTNNTAVCKGQLLLQTDTTQAYNMLHSAQASFEQAQDGYQRLKQVYQQGGVTEVQWKEMQTQLAKAQSLLNSAKKGVSDCTLTAPYDGIITDFDLHIGQNVLPGQKVANLLDISSVNIVFSVPETEISHIAIGDRVQITIPALNNEVYEGRIADKSLSGNKLSHTYTVSTTIPNKHRHLMPSMVCKAHLLQHTQGGYVVPAHCIQIRPEGKSLWVVRNGKACRNSIDSEQFVADGVLINRGLNEGDSLIVSGYQKLYKDAPVCILP
ncbi:MAG: efflux RND transporter periplasmic adaptor subunit [Paludibacter sp.]|nr:efflux RND transporter periplasmic adaptor subunit [Bacteroidales bacterium]MCM1068976.1 efflux RND transporter periplasmic adaptor subunit [Prevotella sp.]MCM1353639.1 efflux RND transporter periplasmic adaptor subunit [Bacteroides sp.]MCM1442012.1 efflux RND transporter periplasmic adaptor subunit [Muribaculum sp.]MCM1481532.1 efflux RND transporter periplasmic adaptor subunit [Paludibacter sp.]